MQAQQTPRPTINFAPFYTECAKYPEIPKFRRLGAQWTKKLFEDLGDLVKKEQMLDRAIAETRKKANLPPLKYLEYPRRLITDEKLKNDCSEFERMLKDYSQNLCLYSQFIHLPDHVPYFSKRLNRYPELFENDDFGPTDERGVASEYQNLDARDFVAVAGDTHSEMLTTLLANHIDWIDQKILQRIRNVFKKKKAPEANENTGVEHATIVKIIDGLTCIFVPFLLTSTMFALARIRPLMIRIAVVGTMGLAFAICAKVISGKMTRGEIFSFSAAFFAVASVFVSTTNGSN